MLFVIQMIEEGKTSSTFAKPFAKHVIPAGQYERRPVPVASDTRFGI